MKSTADQSIRVHVTRFWKYEQDLHFLKELLDSNIDLTWEGEPPPDYHILVAGRPDPGLLEGKPSLKRLIIPWAGVSSETRRLMMDYPHIAVHNLHYNAAATAEMALALLLSAAKGLVVTDRAMRANDWQHRSRPDMSLQLEGMTALLVGYGAIGRRVGQALHALGVNVIAIRRNTDEVKSGDCLIYPAHALTDLLPKAHILVLTLPLTEETEGIIGKRELDLLPQGAILVNIGRGAIVDQQALYNALREGRLHGAGLDVWYNYPRDKSAEGDTPPADYPFSELDNIVMSPHRGGSTLDADRNRSIQLADMLNAAARGEPVPNAVDLEAGY